MSDSLSILTQPPLEGFNNCCELCRISSDATLCWNPGVAIAVCSFCAAAFAPGFDLPQPELESDLERAGAFDHFCEDLLQFHSHACAEQSRLRGVLRRLLGDCTPDQITCGLMNEQAQEITAVALRLHALSSTLQTLEPATSFLPYDSALRYSWPGVTSQKRTERPDIAPVWRYYLAAHVAEGKKIQDGLTVWQWRGHYVQRECEQ